MTAVLGANGAGKTTILRALSGLIRRAGDIRFRGRPIGALATEDVARLGIAHVPDGRGTFSDLTVEENLRLGAYVRADRQGVRADFDRVFGLFPRLAERRRQQAGTLSGGEQQMLAIARALLMRPSLLMLDEPSFGLAPLVVAEIFRVARRDQSRRGREPPDRRAERFARARSRRPGGADRNRTGGAERPLAGDPRRRCGAPRLSRLLAEELRSLGEFLHQLASGLALGGVYAIMALALVMIYQATQLINFAQGEMAMFSTYFAWKLMDSRLALLGRVLRATVVASFIGGVVIERLVVRPFANAPVLASVIVFIGLAFIFNSLAGWLYGYSVTVVRLARSPGARGSARATCRRMKRARSL